MSERYESLHPNAPATTNFGGTKVTTRMAQNACDDCAGAFCAPECPDEKNMPAWLIPFEKAKAAMNAGNHVTYNEKMTEAWEFLKFSHLTRVTGRVCPAPCEGTVGGNDGCVKNFAGAAPVSIKESERFIADYAHEQGWDRINVENPLNGPENTVAIIGSGPAGIAAAAELIQAGFKVEMHEARAYPGGLLRDGIPADKLPDDVVDWELDRLKETGQFTLHLNSQVDGEQINQMENQYAGVIVAIGKETPKAPGNPGRENCENVRCGMDLRRAETAKRLTEEGPYGDIEFDPTLLELKDKKVLVLGAGDTADDVTLTANQLGAQTVKAFRKPLEKVVDERPYDSAYTPDKIGRYEVWDDVASEDGRTLVESYEEQPDGQVKVIFGSGKEAMFDFVYECYGYQAADVNGLKSGQDLIRNVGAQAELAIMTEDIAKPVRRVREAVLAAGDAAHLPMSQSNDWVVTAIADGTQAAKHLIQTRFPERPITGGSPQSTPTFF